MSRAVVVSTASTIIFDYWFENFQKWGHLVDKLYIGNNGGRPIIIQPEAKDKIIVVDNVKYPENIESILHMVTEDVVLIMHDDVFVYDHNYLEMCFELAATRVVTPIHNSHEANDVIETAMKAKFGHHGSFFPYFVFAPMKAVKQTSINLRGYMSTDCPILGVPVNGDQGFLFGLELQQAGYKIFPITRYLAHQFPVNPPWVHAQGLSYNFMAGIVNGADEYKLAWYIEMSKFDIEKIVELSSKLFKKKAT